MKYFDYAATCPIDDAALKIYNEAARAYFGNTSSMHDTGTKAGNLLEHCRQTLADLSGVDSEGIFFTSGGTESNGIALYALAHAGKGKHIITSQAEHSSIHNILEKLSGEGFEITKLPLNKQGTVDIETLKAEIRPDTGLVSIQYINAEIGTIQPVEKIGALCEKSGIFFHSDCVQALGKSDLKQVSGFMDSFSVSSHKVYGPKGVGAVYIRPGISYSPFYPNGTHESGVRPGTVNVAGIAAFTTAATDCIDSIQIQAAHIRKLKETFIKTLEPIWDKLTLVGTPLEESPILGICLAGIEGQWTMLEANRRGYAISTGSACSINEQAPAKTLLAMGYSEEAAKTFIRISFGKQNTISDAEGVAACLADIVAFRHHNTTEKV
ncbi:IscS subfamily cysteine desulfurase [Thalassobacillus pellis]|uniref:IscS subfamily cysteine desulfurase n=1 Tax=Thalassobacillus pellis TaxID=748008 RepID=UPI00195F4768|nr:IscS subfamily cysteine desulfurase [Thalassobacillus pellis]MBM7554153.1 cysteine desulfurase [Thalassobacillus pellis]